jgi:hypothetical protein
MRRGLILVRRSLIKECRDGGIVRPPWLNSRRIWNIVQQVVRDLWVYVRVEQTGLSTAQNWYSSQNNSEIWKCSDSLEMFMYIQLLFRSGFYSCRRKQICQHMWTAKDLHYMQRGNHLSETAPHCQLGWRKYRILNHQMSTKKMFAPIGGGGGGVFTAFAWKTIPPKHPPHLLAPKKIHVTSISI